MKTKILIALRNLYYGRDLKAGEEFEAREEHVQPLLITGGAKLKDEKPNARQYNRRDLRAEN